MKLPRSLPALTEPSFVLVRSQAVQVGFLLFCTLLPVAVAAWLVHVQLTSGLSGSHYALGGVMALLLSLVLVRRNREAWVVFAADPRGVYLATLRGGFVHVGWADVGEASIGIAGIGSNRQRTVILQLRVGDPAWGHLVGGRRRRAYAKADDAGFRVFGIGNAGRDVEDTLRQIARVRAQAVR